VDGSPSEIGAGGVGGFGPASLAVPFDWPQPAAMATAKSTERARDIVTWTLARPAGNANQLFAPRSERARRLVRPETGMHNRRSASPR
jgi:hypothetical protein